MARSVATAAVALQLAIAGCSGGDRERLDLRVQPLVVSPGSLVGLAVVGTDPASASRGSTSVFERRTRSGSWQPAYLLNTDTDGKPAVARPYGRGYAFGVGLSAESPDVVRIPNVSSGVYRISKTVAVLEAPEDDEIRTLVARVYVVATGD